MVSRYYVPLLSQKQKHRLWAPSVLGKYPRIKFFAAVLFLCTLLILFCDIEFIRKFTVYYTASLFPRPRDGDRPPVYTELRQYERNLPQHNPDLPFPEGKTGRYVLFSNSRVNLSGWNNKLNDMLMNTWLAYSSNRAYVFHDFAWTDSHYPWPVSAYREWLPRTPLNALISGPSAGGPWDPHDPAPRSVSESYFNTVCPPSERRIINTRDVKPAIHWADGAVIFETWRTLLADAPERCIEIAPASAEEDRFPETWDIWYWGSERSVSLWDAFVASPVSRLLGTAPIVQSAIDANEALFIVPGRSSALADPFDNVLSIHVRRGDFKEACIEHAGLNSSFYNWNLLPFLPDKFHPPPAPPGVVLHPGTSTPENEAAFLARCLPPASAIVRKVNRAKKAYLRGTPAAKRRALDLLYVMSNDHTEWLDALKATLKRDGWGRIVTSRDLKLNPQQKDVGVAVDMDIGRRSAVFIGNGWSSFTSNVVHRRLADGKAPISIRFW